MNEFDSVTAEAFLTVLKRLTPSQRRAIVEMMVADEELAEEVSRALSTMRPMEFRAA